MKLEIESATTTNSPAGAYPENFDVKGHSAEEAEKLMSSAIRFAKEGDPNAARQMFLRAVELDPSSEAAWLWLASISEYPEELVVFLKKVLLINPANERALEWMRATESLLSKTFVQRGIKAAQENREDFAARCFRQAVEHDAANEMGWLWLASLTELKEEKAAYLKRALEINPENQTARETLLELETVKSDELLHLATSAAISGNREEARRMLREILTDSPELEEAWILRAYLAEEFYEKMSAYEKVLEVNPENEAAQAGLASLRAMQKPAEFKPKRDEEIISGTVTLSSETQVAVANFAPAPDESMLAEALSPALDLETADQYSAFETQDAKADFKAYAQEDPAETGYFADPAHKLDAQVFDAETSFGQYGEAEAAFAASGEEDSAPETIKDRQTSGSFAEYRITESLNDEQFARLLESEDAQAIELLEVDNPDCEEFNLSYEEFDPEISGSGEPLPGSDYATADSDADFNIAAVSLNSFESSPSAALDANTVSSSYEADSVAHSDDYSVAAQIDSRVPAENAAESLEISSFERATEPAFNSQAPAGTTACPFCASPNEAQVVVCRSCGAMLSLSDLESMLTHQTANPEVMLMAINDLEAEKLRRGLSLMQLTDLGIAYLNAGDLRKGLDSLREASQMSPNNVVLSSKVNYLAIRLAEIEAQDCKSADSPVKCKLIMVVDDSPTVRKLISGKLEKSGHRVVCAVDGMDALAKVGEQAPDLILLDINMPNMDGYQVCKMIRSTDATKEIPVVMISGKDGFFDKVRGRMAGSTGYITKPFGPETLMRTLETYLN